ncbi:MAG: type II toxin-antitoxin system HicB family antitoxin [Chloroflexi bacterium]|nr:type II toxin-antitoxin system HicB family antitoxin [Chloroflexota bacterium]
MNQYKLPIEIEPLKEGGFLAICPILQGCHAEGETIAEALENVEDVARIIIEIMREEKIPLPPAFKAGQSDELLHEEIFVVA